MVAARYSPRERCEFDGAHRLDHTDVEQAIVDHGPGGDQTAAADQARVADGERVKTALECLACGFERQTGSDGFELEERLRSADQVRQPAGNRLQVRCDGD